MSGGGPSPSSVSSAPSGSGSRSIASVLYDYGVLYKLKVEQFLNGNLEPNVSMAGVKEGVVNIKYNDLATEEMKNTVSEARKMIAEGEILDMLTRPTG